MEFIEIIKEEEVINKGIYCITNLINNKKYIGSSNNISSRIYWHKLRLKKNLHYNEKLQLDWNIITEELFSFTIIEKVDNNLTNRERYWIEFLKTNIEEFGYNSSLPQTSTKKAEHSIEIKEKQRQIQLDYIENNKEVFYERVKKSRETIKSKIESGEITSIGNKNFGDKKKVRIKAENLITSEIREFESIKEASIQLEINKNRIQEAVVGWKSISKDKRKKVLSTNNWKFSKI